MALEDLRSKYEAGKTKQAINRAIRAEIPGGDSALDGLELLNKMCNRLGWEDPAEGGLSPLAVAFKTLLGVVDDMEDEVRRRYGLPPKERYDLKR